MNGPTRRLAFALFAGFLALLGSVTWFQVIAADTYRDDPRNARTDLARSGKERGVIVTVDGVVLARSLPDATDPPTYRREYPAGAAFSHLVGYSTLLVGDEGLEAAYDATLRSRRDLTISDLIAAILGRDLRPLSLQTTVDAGLQQVAFEALGGQRGSVVALDPTTGAVLAMVSVPSYDPNTLLGPDQVEQRAALLEDPAQPLLDRSTEALYAPGSTFKPVVAAAAFDLGVAGPETEFPDPVEFPLPQSTAVIRNFDRGPCADGGTVTLQVGMVRSCNTTFAQLALQVGAEAIDEVAEAMGFNREIPFPWEVAPSVFPGEQLAADPAALAQSGIGERDVRATPLQMAMVAATIANQGEVMQPYLVRQVFNADGAAVEVTEPRSMGRAMSPATASVLTQLLERVVTEGTGRRATVPGVRVAGKTGTTQAGPEGAPNAWFIGFAPVEQPSIAVAVLVESGGDVGESATGGTVAAPIAARVLEEWLTRG